MCFYSLEKETKKILFLRGEYKKMFEIKPWDEKSCDIFTELSMFRSSRVKDLKIPRSFSKKPAIRNLINNDFLTITSNRRKKESWFNIPKTVTVFPKHTKKDTIFQFKKIL